MVAFELKIGAFKPEYIGKVNFYLEALDREHKKEHENPSVGVILCSSKDDEVVEFAISRSLSPTLIAEYQTKLIDKDLLKQKLHEFSLLAENVDEDAKTEISINNISEIEREQLRKQKSSKKKMLDE